MNKETKQTKKKAGAVIKVIGKTMPCRASFLMSIVIGLLGTYAYYFVVTAKDEVLLELLELLLVGTFFGIFLVWPIAITLYEVALLLATVKNHEVHKRGIALDYIAMLLGVLFSFILMSFMDEVLFESDFMEQLQNVQKHTPIYTKSQLTIWVFLIVAMVGYSVLNLCKLEKLPPLVTVLCMATLYLGCITLVLWGIQVFSTQSPLHWYLLLLPGNALLLTARTMISKCKEWESIETATEKEKIQKHKLLAVCNHLLENAKLWPVIAFVLLWPLWGVLTGILILFGQAPDAYIQAFTNTAEWNLSKQIGPQNINTDQHYLCTVAAGGHRKVVKPFRLGKRHGHQVIVNRQLCIANAFEQILEEKTPGFHKIVRHLYDTYGFPIAKLIKSKYIADIIYILMKPLEWLFLIVLYSTDAKPEDRIARQYLA